MLNFPTRMLQFIFIFKIDSGEMLKYWFEGFHIVFNSSNMILVEAEPKFLFRHLSEYILILS